MRKLLVFLSLVILALPVSAQSAPKPKVVAKSGDKPAPAATAKRPSVLGRIFNRKPDPVPVAVVTSTPTPKPKPKYRPKGRNTPKPAATETEPAEAPDTKPEIKPPAPNKKPVKGQTPPPPTSPDVDEKAKYSAARDKAEEDPAIKELKVKADEALSEADAHSTSVAYNRAVYRKIRELDPSLDGYVDKLEEAMMKRLNSEKKSE